MTLKSVEVLICDGCGKPINEDAIVVEGNIFAHKYGNPISDMGGLIGPSIEIDQKTQRVLSITKTAWHVDCFKRGTIDQIKPVKVMRGSVPLFDDTIPDSTDDAIKSWRR